MLETEWKWNYPIAGVWKYPVIFWRSWKTPMTPRKRAIWSSSGTGGIIKNDGFGKYSHTGCCKCTTNRIICYGIHESYVTTEIHKMYLRYPVLGLSTHRDYIYRRFPFSYSPKQPFIFSFGCAISFYNWSPLAGRHSAALPERQASAISPLPASPSSYHRRIRTARWRYAAHAAVGSSSGGNLHIATRMASRTAYRLLPLPTQNANGTFPRPDVLHRFMPERTVTPCR